MKYVNFVRKVEPKKKIIEQFRGNLLKFKKTNLIKTLSTFKIFNQI